MTIHTNKHNNEGNYKGRQSINNDRKGQPRSKNTLFAQDELSPISSKEEKTTLYEKGGLDIPATTLTTATLVVPSPIKNEKTQQSNPIQPALEELEPNNKPNNGTKLLPLDQPHYPITSDTVYSDTTSTEPSTTQASHDKPELDKRTTMVTFCTSPHSESDPSSTTRSSPLLTPTTTTLVPSSSSSSSPERRSGKPEKHKTPFSVIVELNNGTAVDL